MEVGGSNCVCVVRYFCVVMGKLVEFFDCCNDVWVVEGYFVVGLSVIDVGWLGV